MTDQPVTPDREAHYCVRLGQECTHACPECRADLARLARGGPNRKDEEEPTAGASSDRRRTEER